jgi:hypothetical protein
LSKLKLKLTIPAGGWGDAVAQRLSDGVRKYMKSKDPGFAPQPSQPFKKTIPVGKVCSPNYFCTFQKTKCRPLYKKFFFSGRQNNGLLNLTETTPTMYVCMYIESFHEQHYNEFSGHPGGVSNRGSSILRAEILTT